MSSAYQNGCTSSILICKHFISLPWLIVVARTYSTILRKSSERWILTWIPTLGDRNVQTLAVSCQFFCSHSLSSWGSIPLFLFWKSFYHKWVSDFAICISVSVDRILQFFFNLLIQFSSVAQSCPTLCDPMNRNTPGLPVHHQLPEFTQTHVHRGSDAIQPSHPLSSPSPPAPNPSQHQSLFQWVNSSHEVARVLEFQF